ncbi:MAG TPA: TMEM175 family protein [Thermoleophilaceae bacterium]
MNPARLETFADGVFAIAATLLILTVDGAVGGEGVDLGADLRHAWPSYVAYAVSFVTIGIMWINHHAVLDLVDRVDRRFLMANLGLLMCIAFVPFPTRLLAEHIRGSGAESAALAYGSTLTITAVFFNTIWLYASRGGRLLRADCDSRVVAGLTRTYVPGPWIYLGATLVAFASPTASALLFLAIAAFYIVETSIFGGRQTVAD